MEDINHFLSLIHRAKPLIVGWTPHWIYPSMPEWVSAGGKAYAPLTSTAWDGDAFSTTAKTLIDLSAVFGVPAGVKAVMVFVALRDSGSAGTDCYFILGPTNSPLVGLAVDAKSPDDRYSRDELTVPCNADGDIYYQIGASGTDTMDVILQIWGYYL